MGGAAQIAAAVRAMPLIHDAVLLAVILLTVVALAVCGAVPSDGAGGLAWVCWPLPRRPEGLHCGKYSTDRELNALSCRCRPRFRAGVLSRCRHCAGRIADEATVRSGP